MKLFNRSLAAILSLSLLLFTGVRAGGIVTANGSTTAPYAPSTAIRTLYFLNEPESVEHDGTLASFPLPPRKPARIFFHFKNNTGAMKLFRLTVKNSAMASAHWGVASNKVSGTSGAMAVEDFFNSATQTKDPRNISISRAVPNGYTVSGVVEGTPASDHYETTVVASMGDPAASYFPRPPIESDSTYIRKVVHLEKNRSFTVRLGDQNTSSTRILGDYGSVVRVRVTNIAKVKQKIRIGISPRGGEASFVYRINGCVRRTPIISLRADYGLISVILPPNGYIEMDTMPCGGWNYPLEIRVRSRSAV